MEDWKFSYENWVPEEQALRETLCTLGNGYFATRGAAEESSADGINYPGTYLAGGYNRLKSDIAGRTIENEDLVNWPNWLPLTFRHPKEKWFGLSEVTVVYFKQEVDLKTGVLTRQLRFRDKSNRETSLTSRRFVSMDQPHLAAMLWELTPENWSGPIEIRSALDGNICNLGVARYRQLSNCHLNITETGEAENHNFIYLVAETNQSRVRMAMAARTRISGSLPTDCSEYVYKKRKGFIAQHAIVNCEKQQSIRVEKVVAVYTSRDLAISEPALEAKNSVERAAGFSELLEEHSRVWGLLWKRCDVIVSSTERTQQVLRLHIFHLLQTVSVHSAGMDVGLPARGWHGEAYRGHIFWDELFIFSFLNFRIPELTRDLLMYRYRRLPEARLAAREAGYRGAMFPWQSGSNGREESQIIHMNPKSGRWIPDNTFRQRHINAAVAYNVWQYYQTTNNVTFLSWYGAEIVFEIALFWSSLTTWSEEKQRFEIKGVVGPDEYHTQYPGTDSTGLNNNAYTNLMAVWVLQFALKLPDLIHYERIEELYAKLHISEPEVQRWRDICKLMFIPFLDPVGPVISQFEGYEKLQELDWNKYRKTEDDMLRLDRILESEGDDVNRYKASKQADVLMLFYLFSTEKLIELFSMLGYRFTPECIAENIAYYEPRTSHGSTLSTIVHAWVLARSDRKRSWGDFQTALLSDVEDIQGGTTPEGIHLGAMAGSVDLVQRCFTGLVIYNDELLLNPVLPDKIYYMELRLKYREHWFSLRITQEKLVLAADKEWTDEIAINIRGTVTRFKAGEVHEFPLKQS
ncbi:glycoside hydrolase family 65 protein [Adhaeribacter soli]|uniref:Glycoside hydrolase family 65 protein n=1 Tax=Adhaeribacter soli TaxID=2607655 RepID=A0A5N1J388_9BACT|nr:glycosyl hydrolase family 65 protein [Adhaeribacter soli]KAA9339023.1 glycoside hydrolase family 65 protein [Adhaeribacter soli]